MAVDLRMNSLSYMEDSECLLNCMHLQPHVAGVTVTLFHANGIRKKGRTKGT